MGAPAVELPVAVAGSYAFLSPEGVATPVRLADSAWLTVERMGRGQVILFARVPVVRGMLAGPPRRFGNAVVLGPGLGADAPLGW